MRIRLAALTLVVSLSLAGLGCSSKPADSTASNPTDNNTSSAPSSDTANWQEIIADLAANLPPLSIPLPDVWVSLKPVNPFRSIESVQQALKILAERRDVDSVRVVSEADPRLHHVNASGYLEPYGGGWDATVSKMPRNCACLSTATKMVVWINRSAFSFIISAVSPT